MDARACALIALLVASNAFAAPPAPKAPPPAGAAPEPPQQIATTTPEARNAAHERLARALNESLPQLGPLEPWQKTLFEEEAVPQAQRFIKNFSDSAVDVDLESLKNYLRFHGPTALRKPETRILGVLKIDPLCAKCVQSRDAVKELIEARARRRGLTLQWLGTEDLTNPSLPQRELQDKLVELVQAQAGASQGAISVHLRMAPIDDIDTAHADEKRIQALTFLYVRDPSGHELSKSEGKLEVYDSEALDGVSARLLTDAFTELGARQRKLELEIATTGKTEVEIEVVGIRNYELFTQVQGALTKTLKEEGVVEPRKISRGKAVFALVTGKSADRIRSQLVGMRLDTSSLAIRGISNQVIQMELK
jgi:hypothetical protein